MDTRFRDHNNIIQNYATRVYALPQFIVYKKSDRFHERPYNGLGAIYKWFLTPFYKGNQLTISISIKHLSKFNCPDLIILNLFDKFDMNSHKRVLSMDHCRMKKNRLINNSLPKTRNAGSFSFNQTNDNNPIKFKQSNLLKSENNNSSNVK